MTERSTSPIDVLVIGAGPTGTAPLPTSAVMKEPHPSPLQPSQVGS